MFGFLTVHESSTLTSDLNCIASLRYKFKLLKYDINCTKLVAVDVWSNRKVVFKSFAWNLLYFVAVMKINLVLFLFYCEGPPVGCEPVNCKSGSRFAVLWTGFV